MRTIDWLMCLYWLGWIAAAWRLNPAGGFWLAACVGLIWGSAAILAILLPVIFFSVCAHIGERLFRRLD